jgi:hypothetical protein
MAVPNHTKTEVDSSSLQFDPEDHYHSYSGNGEDNVQTMDKSWRNEEFQASGIKSDDSLSTQEAEPDGTRTGTGSVSSSVRRTDSESLSGESSNDLEDAIIDQHRHRIEDPRHSLPSFLYKSSDIMSNNSKFVQSRNRYFSFLRPTNQTDIQFERAAQLQETDRDATPTSTTESSLSGSNVLLFGSADISCIASATIILDNVDYYSDVDEAAESATESSEIICGISKEDARSIFSNKIRMVRDIPVHLWIVSWIVILVLLAWAVAEATGVL